VLLGGGTQEQQEQAVANSFNTGGSFAGASSVVTKPRNALNMGIKAYHGSPHDFDRFDMSKIGTGEGAQAYGHGLYFAENEGVAKGYRDTLKPGKGMGPEDTASRVLDLHGGDRDAAIATIRQSIDRANANNAPYEEVQKLMQAKNILNTSPEKATGRMYEVSINADPDAFLDWDKPLSEQPEAVRKALKQLDIATGNMSAKDRVETLEAAMSGDPRLAHLLKQGGINITGDTVYRGLSDSLGAVDWPVTADAATRAQFRSKGAAGATDALKQAGIPGIKYLDAGSRGAGDGTRNYVVFDDKLVSIVKKYGIAGASAILGYNVLQGMDPAQAAELQSYAPQQKGSG